MFRRFYPSKTCASVYDIDFEQYYADGFRAVLFDIDNTLVEHEAPCDEKARALFERLRSVGFKTCIISNNHGPRVESFAKVAKSRYICDAGKPSKDGYEKAAELLNVKKEETMMVGDQLFTDIWGANRAGIYSVCTKQIAPDPYFHIKLKRIGEKIVWPFYRLYSSRRKGR